MSDVDVKTALYALFVSPAELADAYPAVSYAVALALGFVMMGLTHLHQAGDIRLTSWLAVVYLIAVAVSLVLFGSIAVVLVEKRIQQAILIAGTGLLLVLPLGLGAAGIGEQSLGYHPVLVVWVATGIYAFSIVVGVSIVGEIVVGTLRFAGVIDDPTPDGGDA